MSYLIPQGRKTQMLADIAARLPVTSTTHTLVDNTSVWTNIPTHSGWTAATTAGLTLIYLIRRGANPEIETGQMSIAVKDTGITEAPLYVDSVETTTPVGVALRGIVTAGTVYIQYTTTSTGLAATMDLIELKRWEK